VNEMGEKEEVLKAYIRRLEKKSKEWRFGYGKEMLSADQLMRKIVYDKNFADFMYSLITGLAMDLLNRDNLE